MRTALFAAAALVVAFHAAPANAMSLSFSWGPTKKCFDAKSPPMKLGGVPQGTTKLRIRMVDQNVPNYPHGGGKVAWNGKASGSLPYGAFRYKGPCPPSPHVYRFTVDALDKTGKKLATAKATKRFP